ncbi:MAG TPA: indole-3-glycerol phosphate synthase TrpC [Patescibacteria group bacterium]|nr:indole-3-glycerol phosphate synthase TrpC [Patescibacteria group bacterium]
MHAKIKEILQYKKAELRKQKQELPLATLKLHVRQSKADFLSAFDASRVGLIAEVKFASPTHPNLGTKTCLEDRIIAYEKGNAVAISVITEPHFFQGELEVIRQVKKLTQLPVLQKDFVIDEYQVYQAAYLGADALLFIARIVSQDDLVKLIDLALELGIEPVVEIFLERELTKALTTSTRVIAVNARDLDTFQIDKQRATQLLTTIPQNYLKLGFSGVETRDDVTSYHKAGAQGVLVGTVLMQASDPAKKLAELQL